MFFFRPVYKGLPADTYTHFKKLFNKHPDHVLSTLQSLSLISDAHSSFMFNNIILSPPKPLTLTLSTNVNESNAFTVSSTFALNNIINRGIRFEASLATSLKKYKLSAIIPSYSLRIPYYTDKGLHTFEANNSQTTTEHVYPFKHTETTTPLKISYTTPEIKMAISQVVYSLKTTPSEEMRGYPNELFNTKNETENSFEISKLFTHHFKRINIESICSGLIGLYNNDLFLKSSFNTQFITHIASNCWFTTQMHAGILLSQSRVALSQYYYLGGNNLRGFKPRGCIGTTTSPHYGGNIIATIGQYVHYQMPFMKNVTLFGFINAGALSFEKVSTRQTLDCLGASCGIGLSINHIEFNIIHPLKKSANDAFTSFQITTSPSFK
ncbi:Bacterial surface antigen (D15) domain-containing protein [Entamoeba marina]